METEEKNKIQIINFMESSDIAMVYDGKNRKPLSNITKDSFMKQLEVLQKVKAIKKVDKPIMNKTSYTFPVIMKEDMTYFVNISKADTEYLFDMKKIYTTDKVRREKNLPVNIKKIGKTVAIATLVTGIIGVSAKIGSFYINKDKKMMDIGEEVNKIRVEFNHQISYEDAYKLALERINAKVDLNNDVEESKGMSRQ